MLELVRQAIARAKRGEIEALRFLYARYADGMLRYVHKERDVPFTAWTLRIARNAALDHMRGRRTIPCTEVWTSDEGSQHMDLERSWSLRHALDRLPEDRHEVLILRHVSGLSPTEIASVLDKTEGSIHGLHHRGRGALRATLREPPARLRSARQPGRRRSTRGAAAEGATPVLQYPHPRGY